MFAVLSVIMQTNLSFAPFASNHGSPTKATTNRLSCPTSQLDTGHTSPSRKDRTARVCLKSIGNFSGGRGDHLPRQRRGREGPRKKAPPGKRPPKFSAPLPFKGALPQWFSPPQ